jgi:hypothetical protein
VDLEDSPEHQSEAIEVYKKVKVDLESSPESIELNINKAESEI